MRDGNSGIIESLRPLSSGGGRVSIGDVLESLGHLALPALLLVTAGINVIPNIPGVSGITGIPLVLIALQRALGFDLWIPLLIRRWSIDGSRFTAMLKAGEPKLRWLERHIRPRFQMALSPFVRPLLDWLILILAIAILIPLPLTAILPALSVCLISIGLLERDGVFIAAGVVLGIFSILLTITVILGVIMGLSAILIR